MRPREAPSKNGVPLTTEAWTGFPIRVASYAASGRTEGLVVAEDAILVWSGGRSEVTLRARSPGRAPSAERAFQVERRSGMLDLVPRGTVFEEIRWRGQPHGCVSVLFERSRLERLLRERSPSFDPEHGLRLNVTDAHVVDLVRRLETQAVENEPFGALYVEGLCLTLATYVYGRYGAEEPRSSPQLPAADTEKLISFVDSHLGADIGLSDLARLVGYSPSHLARVFKRSFGVSLYQYVLHRRVDRAKTLLRDRSLSIAEIALACGFATQSHFSSAFKARSGITPGAYRRG